MANKSLRQKRQNKSEKRGKTLRRKYNTQRKAKKNLRRKTQRGRGLMDYFRGTNDSQQETGKSTYTNTLGRIPGVGATGRFLNRTGKSLMKFNINTLATTQAKLNALLIHLKVPYVFSDGTMATDYFLGLDNVANAVNEGRGYTPATKRAYNATGFSANLGKLYNAADKYLDTQDAQRKYINPVAAPFSENIARGSENVFGLDTAPTVSETFGNP
jgi:hypothetical protein